MLVVSIAVTGRYGANYGEISERKSKKSGDRYQPAGMVLVPGGYFKFGGYGNRIKDRNKNLETVGVASFYIDAAPISNSQYREFIEFAKKNPNGFNSSSSENPDSDNEDEENEDEDIKNSKKDTLSEKSTQPQSDYEDKEEIDDEIDPKDEEVKYMNVIITPDKKAWLSICYDKSSSFYKFLDSFSEDYHGCPAYDSFPIVSISLEAAKEFAQWRTDRLNEYRIKSGLPKIPQFRLPTNEEYGFAQRGGAGLPKYSFGGPNARKFNGEMMLNAKLTRGVLGECGYMGPSPVGRFPANKYGIYDMSGNVASWTSTTAKSNKGEELKCSMGGSWIDFSYYCQVDTVYYSNGEPSPGIGIRCVTSVVGF